MDKTIIDGIVQVIQTVGFPIVACLWFMFRMEKKIEAQTAVMREIADALRQHLANQ